MKTSKRQEIYRRKRCNEFEIVCEKVKESYGCPSAVVDLSLIFPAPGAAININIFQDHSK